MSAANSLSHTGPDGSSPGDRIQAAGYTGWRAWAENIAEGQKDVAAVMASWTASSGHYANMVSTSVTHVGFGMTSTGGPWWVQDFGASGVCG